MPNPIWPKELQQNPNQNYTEEIDDGVIRSKPDVGPTMSRPRFTRVRIKPKMSIWVNKNDYKIFMDFYNIELIQGCLEFDWVNPIKQTPATLKFMKPPIVNHVGPMDWEIQCEFEEV